MRWDRKRPRGAGTWLAPSRHLDLRTACGRGGAATRIVGRSQVPPILFGKGSRPQARIAGDPTFHCLVRFPRMLLAHSHCQVVWPACYIPPGKSLACFDDLRLHS